MRRSPPSSASTDHEPHRSSAPNRGAGCRGSAADRRLRGAPVGDVLGRCRSGFGDRLYRRDYVGYGWTIGGSEQSGPSNLFGLDVEPVVVGLRQIAARLGPTTILE